MNQEIFDGRFHVSILKYQCAVDAGFVSPSTLHTVEIEDANGDVNCWAACTLGLRHNYSETVVCTSAKPTVVFQDLAEGEYTITANCDESRISCYAGMVCLVINEINTRQLIGNVVFLIENLLSMFVH